jgi:hypothetical protein
MNDKIELVQLEIWKGHTKTKYIIACNPPNNITDKDRWEYHINRRLMHITPAGDIETRADSGRVQKTT